MSAGPDESAGHAGIRIDADAIQQLTPPNGMQRFEGVAYSTAGDILAVATADTSTVFLFRRKPGGRFEDKPCSTITGPGSRLNYPHDLAFAPWGQTELLAVAQRTGSVCVYARNGTDGGYGPEPIFEIQGRRSKLNYSDGVAFVPPDNRYLAACNLRSHRITFYRRAAGPSVAFETRPAFKLRHRSIRKPDGLAFSPCGTWLAVANHGAQTISIHRRRRPFFFRNSIRYGRRPVTVIADPSLRYPHSLAFTPRSQHLVVTNAGANYFNVYSPEPPPEAPEVAEAANAAGAPDIRWSQTPVLQRIVGPDDVFRKINVRNKMEGGPKGVAIHGNEIAICSPEHGVKLYALHEPAPPGGAGDQ